MTVPTVVPLSWKIPVVLQHHFPHSEKLLNGHVVTPPSTHSGHGKTPSGAQHLAGPFQIVSGEGFDWETCKIFRNPV